MTKPKPEAPKGLTFVAIYEPDLKAQVEALRIVLRSRPACEKEVSESPRYTVPSIPETQNKPNVS